VRAPGASDNELPAILRAWFGDEVGLPGRTDRVRFRRDAHRTIMEPAGLNGTSASGLTLWERYLREQIPEAFGLPYNSATWYVGLAVSTPHIFLLVTLTKDDMHPDHQYADHFLTDQEFNWQSQNQTAQDSKRGQMIQNHRAMGMHVHLLVRPTKKT